MGCLGPSGSCAGHSLGGSRELFVEVVEEVPSDVDDEPRLGLSKQLGARVHHAPPVPNGRSASRMLAPALKRTHQRRDGGMITSANLSGEPAAAQSPTEGHLSAQG